ncbi:MAG: SDR family oxidoreductase, partial [Acidobacteriota bacterium]
VFDGRLSHYCETDEPGPVLEYGRSKLAGEAAARDVLLDRAVVVRLALLYGWGLSQASRRRSFAARMLAEAKRGRSVWLFADQFRSPLYVEDAALGMVLILRTPRVPPLLHLGGPERLSRHQIGLAALEVFGLDPALAKATSMRDVPSRAARPVDVSLDIRRARRLGFDPRGVRQGFEAMRRLFPCPQGE